MARIRREDIEAVKERTNLVEVVSEFLTLKRSGADSMTGLCPFHEERTPSFSVSPSKGVFYCFGCGKGGDAITFLRELEGLTYVEAVERLAQRTGVVLRWEGDSEAERAGARRRQALHRANEEAAALYRQILLEAAEGEPARAYLEQRGIDRAAVERFAIGYAPGPPDFLLRRLAGRRDLSSEVLLDAGLVTRGRDGSLRDRFRARITFPIHDLQGRAIGFGARILPSDPRAHEQAKYLNTAETAIYRKHEVLYNLHRARAAIARTGEAIVVEGYTDVIAMDRAGIENVVATCGTALGDKHLELLSRFAARAVLAFDSDEAGARAAERAFDLLERFPIQAFVMIIPDGLDPADAVRRQGADAVRELVRGSRPLIDFMLRRMVLRHPIASPEGRSAAIRDGVDLIARIRSPEKRAEYAGQLVGMTNAEPTQVFTLIERARRGRPVEPAQAAPPRRSARERVEREMLKLLARDADISRGFMGRLGEEHFTTAAHRRAFEALREAQGDISSLVAGADERLAATIAQLAVEPLEGEPTMEYAERVWARLQEFLLKSRSEALRLRLQKLNPTTDPNYEELFRELVAVDGDLRRLREGVRDVV